MFHDLLTIMLSFEQFTDFNGLFDRFSSKIMFLCARETSCKPKSHGSSLQMGEVQPMLSKHRANRNPMEVHFKWVRCSRCYLNNI